MAKSAKVKKILSIVFTVLAGIIFLFAVFVFIVTVKAKAENKSPEFFGYSFSIVVTDSMTPEIEVGELISVRTCDISEVEVGDNAVFIKVGGPLDGKRIVHKCIETGKDENGDYIITQGVKQFADIDGKTYAENFVGICTSHSAFLGGVATFFTRVENWIFLLVSGVAVFIGVKAVKTILSAVKEKNGETQEPSDDGEKKDDAE